MKSALIAAVFATGLASPVLAANADQPYQNIDKRNDAGNSTGDAKVDALNRGQLDQNQGSAAPALGMGATPAPVTIAPSTTTPR
ncbi:MAG: hypothetical protein NVSMB18_27510 [Acetobacteraceae bacterium]